jgi:thiosulfate reductase cytochrome b subunit
VAGAVSIPGAKSAARATAAIPRHSALVRITHWITTICFLALLVTGIVIIVAHPRFYWGETGNVLMKPLFQFHIPASRASVPTGYGYVLKDHNGLSRYLHFKAAWLAILTGAVYLVYGFLSGHFRRNLFPHQADCSWSAFSAQIGNHLRFRRSGEAETWSYNSLQRITYLLVIFVLFPCIIWTGLAMSPAVVSAFPILVTSIGGQQSARTIHFFVSVLLLLFLVVHVTMIYISGFRNRMRGMITGHPDRDR